MHIVSIIIIIIELQLRLQCGGCLRRNAAIV